MSKTKWYNLIYDLDELRQLSNFQREHRLNRRKRLNNKQNIRFLLLFAMLFVIGFTLLAWPIMNIFVCFTNWTMLV